MAALISSEDGLNWLSHHQITLVILPGALLHWRSQSRFGDCTLYGNHYLEKEGAALTVVEWDML